MAKVDTAESKTKTDKPAKTGKPGRAAKPDRPNWFARLPQYFRDVRTEMKRVVWPNRTEVGNMWLVVVVTLIFFSISIFLLDLLIVELLQLIAGVR